MRKLILGGLLMTTLGASALAGGSSSKEVTLEVVGAKLSATLQQPSYHSGKKAPVALILAGSGPTNRDGNSMAGAGGTYRKLAEYLSTRGIASLRPDKRGIGKSLPQDNREEALSFEDYVNDARAWISWLAMQPKLGPVVVIGHSEGGLVTLAALQKEQPIAGAVLLAAPSETIGKTISRQIKENPNNPPEIIAEAEEVLRELERGRNVNKVSQPLMPLFRPSVQPYLKSLMTYEPLKLAAKVKTPMLIVQGDRDLQIRPKDAQLLKASAPNAKLHIVSGVNHVLVPAPQELKANFATYGDPNLPLARGVVLPIAEFISELSD